MVQTISSYDSLYVSYSMNIQIYKNYQSVDFVSVKFHILIGEKLSFCINKMEWKKYILLKRQDFTVNFLTVYEHILMRDHNDM